MERQLSKTSEKLKRSKQSEKLPEELLDKDGELREPAALKHGGVTDSLSTDGDSAEECQEHKVTGISEDTLILERLSALETGKLLKNIGENSVSKKEETSLLTEI